MFKPESPLGRAIAHAMAEQARVGSLDGLSAAVRTVLVVHAAQGVIDNGGLQYFFEADFPGQPPYAVFVDAYRAIVAVAEADALAAAVALFPFADPHKHRRRRDRMLSKFEHGGGDRTDSPFDPYTDQLCGNERVWQRLAAYVEANAADFADPNEPKRP